MFRIVCNPSLCATIRESCFYVAAMVQYYRTAVLATTSMPQGDEVLVEIQNEIQSNYMNDPIYLAWADEFDEGEQVDGDDEEDDGTRRRDATRDAWVETMRIMCFFFFQTGATSWPCRRLRGCF